MTPAPLQIAVVGCGAVVTELHSGALRRLLRSGVVGGIACVDRDISRAAACARLLPGAQPFPDIASAAVGMKPSAALVATPPALHRPQVEELLGRGIHVLCEKPFTITGDDAQTLGGAAVRAQRTIAVGMTRRFFPSLATAAQRLQADDLGAPIRFTYREGGVYTWPVQSLASFTRRSGGGVLLDKGVHVLDTLLWLLGPLEVAAAQDDALGTAVESNCRIELRGERAEGIVQLSWDQELHGDLHLRGTRAEMRVRPYEFRFIERREGSGPWHRIPCDIRWPADLLDDPETTLAPQSYDDCIFLEWIHFLRAAAGLPASIVNAHDAGLVVRQMEAATGRATPLPAPWLSEREQQVNRSAHWRGVAR